MKKEEKEIPNTEIDDRHFRFAPPQAFHPQRVKTPSSLVPSAFIHHYRRAASMKYCIVAILACLSAALVHAQTVTTTDALGETVIEVATLDVNGLPTTEILQTVTTAADPGDETTAAATTTTTPLNQGPVAQPAATETGETIFTYTTTDANGDTTAIVDTFTPSFVEGTTLPPQTYTGTVLDYSSWLSLVGTNTVAADASTNSARAGRVSRGACGAGAALLAGVLGGAWLVVG
ncbi:hypothetical protein M0805_005881 [Coniferiporia weirii]|nr:hypothetical protein M0805_005881 [Coniferiporia weirii]